MIPKYKVLTKISVLDVPYETDEQNERDLISLVNEQAEILEQNGLDLTKSYTVHFFDSAYTHDHFTEINILEAIEYLAIKDGYDLVRFENGRIGYVAYYSTHENGFEILGEVLEKGE